MSEAQRNKDAREWELVTLKSDSFFAHRVLELINSSRFNSDITSYIMRIQFRVFLPIAVPPGAVVRVCKPPDEAT